jgi:serine protease Do
VIISDVAPGMPAQRAGLIGGDTVVAINGNPVREQDDLFLHIAAALAGSEVEVRVERRGDTRTFKARLAKSNREHPFIASTRPRAVHGLRVDYVSTLPTGFAVPEGVLVKELEPNSPAERALKKDFDRGARLIVVAVDGTPVPTPPDFYRAADKGSVTLDVIELGPDLVRKKVTLP